MVIAMYYAIHVVLMGTLSTDLTVPVPSRCIESLSDLLYDPEFNHTEPVIFRQMNMYSVLKHSRKGTIERDLFEKIIANETSRVKGINIDKPEVSVAVITAILEEAVQGHIAIIENSQVLDPSIINGLCYFSTELVNKIRPAKDVIARSILSVLISKATPIEVRRILEYRIMAAGEMGLIKGSAQSYGKSTLQGVGNIPLTTAGMVCAEKADLTFRATLDSSWEIFNLDPFTRLIRICLGIVLIAFLVLVFEKLLKISTRVPVKKQTVRVRHASVIRKVEPE